MSGTFATDSGPRHTGDMRYRAGLATLNFEILMGTFAVGIAAMLGIMGTRQWKMGYRIAGGLSLITATLILVGAVAAVVYLV